MAQHPSFIIYNASAGSGKTFTLVKEYLKILLDYEADDAYKYILSITFTNKAVQEMKSRIVQSLADFSNNEKPIDALPLLQTLVNETKKSENTIRQKARKILKKIIHNYTTFGISTIDTFTHKVIRSFATDLNLPANFDISLDTKTILNEAIERVLAKAGDDGPLTKILIQFALDKTDDDKSWDITRELQQTGQILLNENDAPYLDALAGLTLTDFIEIHKEAREKIQILKNELKADAQFILNDISGKNIDLPSFSRQNFPNHIKKIMAGDEVKIESRNYHLEEKITVNKGAKDFDIINQYKSYWASLTEKIYQKMGLLEFYIAFQKNIIPLALLHEIYMEMKNIEREENVLSISEFNKIIANELKNQPAPFIYERMGEKYRHFFIDEFQDTSILQWENMHPLIENALAGQNDLKKSGTAMLVGDPKQAIYRWRGGKAEQLIDLSNDYNPFNHVAKQVYNLDTNYRSHAEIIAFNNGFFKFLANQFSYPQYHDLYALNSFQNTNPKNAGYVNLQFIPKALLSEKNTAETEEQDDEAVGKDLYGKKVLDIINHCIELGYSYTDVAILTRKKVQGTLIAQYLSERNIPVISGESLLLAKADKVKLLLSALYLIKNSQDVAQAVFLIYFLNEFKPNTLPAHDLILKAIQINERGLSEKAFEQFLWDYFKVSFSFNKNRKISVIENVQWLADQFFGEETHDAFVHYFLDLVYEQNIIYKRNLADFLKYFEDNSDKLAIPSPENADAVQIMTIHKSKGLEFPIVILPFSEFDISRSHNETIWVPIPLENANVSYTLIDFSKKISTYSETIQTLYEKQREEKWLDYINVTYVALTRPTDHLYIIAPLENKNENTQKLSNLYVQYLTGQNLFSSEKLEYEFGQFAYFGKNESKHAAIESFNYFPKIKVAQTVRIATREAWMWENEQAKAIAQGNILHDMLKNIDDDIDIPSVITQHIINGNIHLDEENLFFQKLQNIVHHPELADFFNPQSIVITELALLKNNAPTLKPDRINVIGKKAFLLDYKTGNPETKHKNQIEEYAEALSDMGYEIVKKILVYIGDDIKIINL